MSFLLKAFSALITLLMVPLTITCLGEYQNGVWLTVSSLLVWIDQMDIGLGNGLRNKLAESIAHNDTMQARQSVSSTMAMLTCITLPLTLLLVLLVVSTDVYAFFNADQAVISDLRAALLAAVVLVCITFVLKIVGNVYMGLQQPATSNLILVTGQALALLATWMLMKNGQATFFNIVIANTAAPLAAFLIAFIITFCFIHTELRPSLRFVNIRAAMNLGNLGIKFFWLQVAGIIQFMTANILISNFFTPQMVTPYQIAYRYMSLIIVVFTVICMPFWNATTDAYARGDMEWIRRANRKMSLMSVVIALLMMVMVLLSPWVYDIWIEEACHVPFGMTVMMALYIFLLVLSMRYSYFLNGIGALRLQLGMTVFTVIFIPLAWIVCRMTHDILWFMAVMCLCIAPSILVNMIQFNKILNGTAKGIWKI
jgi:O-antigen/teichoic acid export membrane protein